MLWGSRAAIVTNRNALPGMPETIDKLANMLEKGGCGRVFRSDKPAFSSYSLKDIFLHQSGLLVVRHHTSQESAIALPHGAAVRPK